MGFAQNWKSSFNIYLVLRLLCIICTVYILYVFYRNSRTGGTYRISEVMTVFWSSPLREPKPELFSCEMSTNSWKISVLLSFQFTELTSRLNGFRLQS